MSANVVRIAAWSGPRNISTAMMRAWENREDAVVVDEPFYAYFLAETGLDHPGRDEVLRAGETNPDAVAASLLAPLAAGKRVFYQKHMAHHMLGPLLGGGPPAWFREVRHAFLLRDPREVLASYIKSRPEVSAEDLGVHAEWRLMELVRALGETPIVFDAADFLRAPEAHLRAWCAHLGIDFSPRMLSWPAGPRASDGVWAPHWYDAVLASTGFEPWRPRDVNLPARYQPVLDACLPVYEQMLALRTRV